MRQPLAPVLAGLVRVRPGQGAVVPRRVGSSRLGRDGQLRAQEAVRAGDDAFHGPPNFVLDVFDTKDDRDFLRRRDRFCKAGVHEYFVAINDEPVGVFWHRLEGGTYHLVEPDENGIIYSHAPPNFWVPLNALQERDWWTMLGLIERGVSRRANFN